MAVGCASLADIEAIEETSLSEYDLPATSYEMLRRGASLDPEAPALSFFLNTADFRKPVVWSHRQLMARIVGAANGFRRLGIGRSDVIAFVLPNLPETHMVLWGGETAGIVFPINPLLESEAIEQLLRSAKAKWLVTLAPTPGTDLWEKASAAARNVPGLQGILTVSMGGYLPPAKRLALTLLAAWKVRAFRDSGKQVLDFHRHTAPSAGGQLEFEPPQAEDVCSYFCTGGTTGLPKIAVRTHRSEVFDCWAMGMVVSGAFAPRRSIFCGLPLFHVNGQLVTGLAPWSRGAHVVIGTPQGYRGEGVVASFWEIAEHYSITAFSGVPTLYAGLLKAPVKGRDLSSLKFAICGAAPMPVALFERFERETGVKILEAYGLTEAACASAINPPSGERRVGSVGLRLPFQPTRVAITDENGAFVRFAGVDEPGALVLCGPNVFQGYLDPAHNKDVWLTAEGERWLNTGDLARIDAQGYIWLTGRKKEIIIRGGHNIDPASIEGPLSRHPAIALAAAVPRPDARVGELPVAYVQLHPGVEVSEEELLQALREQITERAAVPHSVRILPALPLTPVGKIFKPTLILMETEQVVREHLEALGLEALEVQAVRDESTGVRVRVRLASPSEELKAALEQYAFHTEIQV